MAPRRAFVFMVLVIHAAMLAWGAYRHSPTVDEPAYLAAGISHWQFGRFDLARVSPPLVRMVAAVPLLFADPKTDWSNYRVGPGVRSEHGVGRDFVAANGRRSFWLFTLARWACIPFSLVGALVCYRWSAELYGVRAGCAALLLWCFCPNVLAHGQLMTADIGVTALSLSAAYVYWRWAHRPHWLLAVAGGTILGLAVLAKTNAVVLVGLLPLLGTGVQFLSKTRTVALRLVMGQQLSSLLVCLYVINLGYGFDGTFKTLGSYQFVSQSLGNSPPVDGVPIGNRFTDSFLAAVPLPIPAPFLEGIDLQRRDFENLHGSAKTYFRGQWYDQGWWWYYFYVVVVKEPLGAWLLLLVAIISVVRWQRCQVCLTHELFVVLPCMSLFALACSQTGFGHSLRYVLPAFPFAFVFASQALRFRRCGAVGRFVAATAVAWHIVSSTSVYPHSLAYFNELAGGPRNGDAHLLDGNLEWGQNLLFLEDWLASQPDSDKIHVAYWGFLPLSRLDVPFAVESPPSRSDQQHGDAASLLEPGRYAVSVNFLRGDYRIDREAYRALAEVPRQDTVGYTICIINWDSSTEQPR